MDKPEMIFFFDLLGKEEGNERNVIIRHTINPKISLGEIECSLAYGDLTLIVAMIRDYVRGLDQVKEEDMLWKVYYREKFLKMADRISEQIGYDYDAAVERCQKKLGEKESNKDIGEDALILALKHQRPAKKEEVNGNREIHN